MNLRLVYILITAAVFLLEILIATYLRNLSFIRGFLGDVLVVSLMYFFLRALFIRFSPLKMILLVLAFAFCIEFLQLFNLYPLLNIQSKILKIVLGSVFDIWDLFAYLLGAILTYLADILMIKNRTIASSK